MLIAKKEGNEMTEQERNRIRNNRLVKEYQKMQPEKFNTMKEKVLSFFDSEEMKAHLNDKFLLLDDEDLIDIIVGAHRPIAEKTEIMTELANLFPDNDDLEDDLFIGCHDFKKYAKQYQDYPTDMHIAADEEAIYILRCYWYDDEKDSIPKFSFESALKYIDEYVKSWEYNGVNEEEFLFFEIEKWIKDCNGDSVMKSRYTLFSNKEIWDYCYGDDILDLWHQFGWKNAMELDLPIPFTVGDIVTIDCRPSAPITHAVILNTRYKAYAPCTYCLYLNNDGTVDYCSLESSSNGRDSSVFSAQISPLYKLERCHNELPTEEAFMTELSAEIVKWYKLDPENMKLNGLGNLVSLQKMQIVHHKN